MSSTQADCSIGNIPRVEDLSKVFIEKRLYLLLSHLADLDDIRRGSEYHIVVFKDDETGQKRSIECRWKGCVPTSSFFIWTGSEIQRSGPR